VCAARSVSVCRVDCLPFDERGILKSRKNKTTASEGKRMIERIALKRINTKISVGNHWVFGHLASQRCTFRSGRSVSLGLSSFNPVTAVIRSASSAFKMFARSFTRTIVPTFRKIASPSSSTSSIRSSTSPALSALRQGLQARSQLAQRGFQTSAGEFLLRIWDSERGSQLKRLITR